MIVWAGGHAPPVRTDVAPNPVDLPASTVNGGDSARVQGSPVTPSTPSSCDRAPPYLGKHPALVPRYAGSGRAFLGGLGSTKLSLVVSNGFLMAWVGLHCRYEMICSDFLAFLVALRSSLEILMYNRAHANRRQ